MLSTLRTGGLWCFPDDVDPVADSASAKAAFSGLLAAVEAGETLAITRRGRVIARLVPALSGGPGRVGVWRREERLSREERDPSR
ncbi:type II toxin-antitoxin system Phd/YefM family antitoxin [Thiorhodovibrio frisius]|uniref:type II toxin-antitoxin system Phd/YefM family antitoxin n=1 Tax=Thiorhodovibrio frisius TaxID=631362 RepID=UPI000255E2CF|nr:type II toxin-antitoxin system prevent-host-death family antitoxin [Thiorhodovibrio frisius]